MAGMVDHCDFFEQQTITTEDARLRPDVIVRLPGAKSIVVDSKAPIAAYLEALETSDDAVREERLRSHARQVRDHMTKLSAKAYWEQFEASPEFVVMFLPGESFFSAALQYDPALIEYGVEERVIPASPTTLIALLRAVAYGWQQERLAKNAERISALGRELHERICVWVNHLTNVGKNLGEAVDAYNEAMGSLERRVLVSTRRFEELGSASTRELPEAPLVERVVRANARGELGTPGEGIGCEED
jgi:DNA recombination protein RmuC